MIHRCYFISTRYNPATQPKKRRSMQLKESVVLFPSVGMGHIIPMVELAKLFIGQGFSVTIVVVEPPVDVSITNAPFISRVSSEYPSISFHRLPKVVSPAASRPPVVVHFETLRLACPHLLDFLKTIRSTSNVRALVLDMFCTSALDVADELGLPSYFFFASGASALAAFLLLPTLQSKLDGNFRDLGSSPVHFPGLPPVPASDLLIHIQERGEANDAIMFHFKRLPKAKGIMINTMEWLEKRAVEALANGDCLPDRSMPPVYCIGPLVANGSNGGEGEGERHECLAWLDAQPEKSVVFLCFGSMGSFSAEQVKEMAIGLERSGQQFLWVVRSPPPKDDPAARPGARPEPDLEALLPEGFLERTRGKGMVVKSWAPQAAVLAHRSVGGFVSHCGWNSTLEAVSSGVPIIAWPLYAEQRMNKVFLVEEAKLAVAMEWCDKDVVSAEEVEKKIRRLMESEDGKAMKDRAVEAKEKAVAAWKEDGSSSLAWLELVRAVRRGA
ncbi:putative anthocyanidin 5,3-O-glucosyltransferase [Iris pallida]|uniref:Glycosyltransferase n=1 Tax=Iris pallida TaxID=29817 RepID=A0AAX6GNK8_IRIPA|nr:putative anthocyanidin 5,3-O-glucosyltransferase [Iris pallida]